MKHITAIISAVVASVLLVPGLALAHHGQASYNLTEPVTVTGTVAHNKMHGMKEDAKSEAKEHGMGKHSTEHGHLTVTNLTMVSESCTK